MSQPKKKRIAIVGGGISGISCMWSLRKTDLDVFLYEAEPRLGGHANSVPFEGNGNIASVDTGFIAMHETFYPKFNNFLKSLNVETIPTDMSFGVSADRGAFEWSSVSFFAFVGSIFNIFSLWFWRLLFDIVRFHYCATDIFQEDSNAPECSNPTCLYEKHKVAGGKCDQATSLESIGHYLHRHSYSEQFKKYYIIPMGAAPRCIDPDDFARDFPAITLIRFMYQHGLLHTIFRSCCWRSFRNGSKTYVDAFLRSLEPNQHIHLDSPIRKVTRQTNGTVSVAMRDDSIETFDYVVLAIHANQALRILGDGATTDEVEILRHFKTTRNICFLHSDETLMPRRQMACSSWNVLMESSVDTQLPRTTANIEKQDEQKTTKQHQGIQKISITFDMNRLQGIPRPGVIGSPGRTLVSMNPIRPPKKVKSSFVYYHPLFTSDSFLTTERLHLINGVSAVMFAGAWMGHGFHEDGFRAGSQAAEMILENSNLSKYSGESKETHLNEIPEVQWSVADELCRVVIRCIQALIEAF